MLYVEFCYLKLVSWNLKPTFEMSMGISFINGWYVVLEYFG